MQLANTNTTKVFADNKKINSHLNGNIEYICHCCTYGFKINHCKTMLQ